MSLLSEAMEECQYIDKTTQADGYGGVETVWTAGAKIQAAVVLDTSMEARRAEAEGVKSLYTIVTGKAITLMYGEIIQRLSDGAYFKITSDGTDKRTPASAGLDMRTVTAEKLDGLPNGQSTGNT